MMTQTLLPSVLCAAALQFAAVTSLYAQGWTFDARKIALGGAGDGNLATNLAGEQRPYRVVALPFGVFRVLADRDHFDPGSSSFDPILLIEDAVNPLHVTLGRDVSPARAAFVNDIRNARLARDLNVYRGFVPANALTGEGLVDSTLGYTIRVSKPAMGGFQGIRLAAGPYIPLRSTNVFDPELRTLLASASPVVLRNTTLDITSQTRMPAGVAIAGGYRAHFPWQGPSPRDGLYVAADFDYIRGLRHEDIALSVAIDTDASGLVTVRPGSVPLSFVRQTSSSGSGRAVNLGVHAVKDHVEVGAGVRGIANRMTWTDLETTTYALRSLTSGDSDFTETAGPALARLETTVPVEYRFNAAYHTDGLSVLGDVRRGFNGTSVHAGSEYRMKTIELRAGARYSSGGWNPSLGAGWNVGPRVGVDVSLFTTTANIERRRDTGLATSLRLMPSGSR